MDGNGRWATRRGLPRVAGHRAGVAAVRRIVERAPALGIRRLTLYAFLSGNWRRPTDEVGSIFSLLRAYPRLETERLRQHGAQRNAKANRLNTLLSSTTPRPDTPTTLPSPATTLGSA
jgi:undecaprenyl diphosphate synthase